MDRVVALFVWASVLPALGCSANALPQGTSVPVTVCEAAKRPIGSRVVVTGEFDGFGYETNSMRVRLVSAEICSDRGAGSVVATLLNRLERDRPELQNARPRSNRDPSKRGDLISLEGDVAAIKDGRFVEIVRAVYRPLSNTPPTKP